MKDKMVYIDEPTQYPPPSDPRLIEISARNGHRWSHMWTDPGSEMQLHRVARALTLRAAWFQDKPGFPHYEVVAGRYDDAVAAGAVPTNLREWLAHRRQCLRAQLNRMIREDELQPQP